jgi:rhamnosyltransferase
VISSSLFQNFWNEVKYFDNILEVISRYETQLTHLLSLGGFRYDALYTQNLYITNMDKNVPNFHPDILIQNNGPFLKVKAFLDFKSPLHIIFLLQKYTNYPVNLIYEHITQIYNPNLSLRVCNKVIFSKPVSIELSTKQKIAIYLDCSFIDGLDFILLHFSDVLLNFDLYITTDTTDKEKLISKKVCNTILEKRIKKIYLTEKKGKDILPWLELANILSIYDIVGHFHTDNSINTDISNMFFFQETLSLLFGSINTIIKSFEENKKVGIIIPEIPNFQQLSPDTCQLRTSSVPIYKKFWKKMKFKKEIDFANLDVLIFPYNNMFWYRPTALKSLYQLRLSKNDHVSLLHCIKQLLVYIAWNDGFDFRIVTHESPQKSDFINSMYLNKAINRIKKSKTYLIGRLIIAIPKFIKKKLESL